MNRNEFETEFNQPNNSHVRLAHLMLALRHGPNWRNWAAAVNDGAPSYYNEVMFLQCAALFMVKPTRRKLLTLNAFFSKRTDDDRGFLMDPLRRTSQARRDFQAMLPEVMGDFKYTHNRDEQDNYVKKPQHMVDRGLLTHSGEAKAELFRARMRAVVTDLWGPGGAMRLYLTNVVGNLSHQDVVRQCGANLNTAIADQTKKDWLVSMINKWEGNSMSRQLGTPFDVVQLGVTSPFLRNRVMGSYR